MATQFSSVNHPAPPRHIERDERAANAAEHQATNELLTGTAMQLAKLIADARKIRGEGEMEPPIRYAREDIEIACRNVLTDLIVTVCEDRGADFKRCLSAEDLIRIASAARSA